jgi:hypothetical protein
LYFKLLPDSSDLLPEYSQLGAERRKQCREVMLLSKTIVVQHFKLLTGLRHPCNFKFLSSGQHTYRNHRDEVAAITVTQFDQTMLADVEMLYIKETVFGVRDGAPLMDCTHPCLVALAAESHWPPHTRRRTAQPVAGFVQFFVAGFVQQRDLFIFCSLCSLLFW